MSKRFRQGKNFIKSIRNVKKLTFNDYKISVHWKQKREKRERKNFLKAKSMLRQGRESVYVGNAFYYWGEDKKSIFSLMIDFDMIRSINEMIENSTTQNESNN